jgi:hypothetical protein
MNNFDIIKCLVFGEKVPQEMLDAKHEEAIAYADEYYKVTEWNEDYYG